MLLSVHQVEVRNDQEMCMCVCVWEGGLATDPTMDLAFFPSTAVERLEPRKVPYITAKANGTLDAPLPDSVPADDAE